MSETETADASYNIPSFVIDLLINIHEEESLISTTPLAFGFSICIIFVPLTYVLGALIKILSDIGVAPKKNCKLKSVINVKLLTPLPEVTLNNIVPVF
jgi:hypothetical protein